MALPKIIKDRMDLFLNDQLTITLFPEPEGQPEIDVIKVNFKDLEGNELPLYLTPCEAMELSSGLTAAVQFYLYNQEQYRTDILKPREKISAQRLKKSAANRAEKAKNTSKCSEYESSSIMKDSITTGIEPVFGSDTRRRKRLKTDGK